MKLPIFNPPIVAFCKVLKRKSSTSTTTSFFDFSRTGFSSSPSNFGFDIYPNFINDKEHDLLLHEADKYLSRKSFLKDHFDGVISGYREGLSIIEGNSKDLIDVSQRIYKLFPKKSGPLLQSVHYIELSQDGAISKHVDSIKFSGGIVAGISLVSDCVMRLYPVCDAIDASINEKTTNNDLLEGVIDVFIQKKSLYIMSGEARYHWAHSIPNGELLFKNKCVSRKRRVSMIFRDQLDPTSLGRIEKDIPFKGSFAEKVLKHLYKE